MDQNNSSNVDIINKELHLNIAYKYEKESSNTENIYYCVVSFFFSQKKFILIFAFSFYLIFFFKIPISKCLITKCLKIFLLF